MLKQHFKSQVSNREQSQRNTNYKLRWPIFLSFIIQKSQIWLRLWLWLWTKLQIPGRMENILSQKINTAHVESSNNPILHILAFCIELWALSLEENGEEKRGKEINPLEKTKFKLESVIEKAFDFCRAALHFPIHNAQAHQTCLTLWLIVYIVDCRYSTFFVWIFPFAVQCFKGTNGKKLNKRKKLKKREKENLLYNVIILLWELWIMCKSL